MVMIIPLVALCMLATPVWGEPRQESSQDSVSVPTAPANTTEQDVEEFRQYIRQQLLELEDTVVVLRNKSTDLHETTKSALLKQLESLSEQQAELTERLDSLKRGSDKAWTELRKGLLNAMDELQASVARAAQSK